MISRSLRVSVFRPRVGRGARVRLSAVASTTNDRTLKSRQSQYVWFSPKLICSGLLLFALATPVAARATPPDVTLTQGRMQVLLPSRPAAGYFTLENKGDTPQILSGAAAPDCQSLMMHRSTTDGGTARMAMVDSVQVPAHGTVSFEPGGYHLMCMQPSGTLLTHKGTETVTLHFAGGDTISASFAIEGARR